jgi:hypothetical protein
LTASSRRALGALALIAALALSGCGGNDRKSQNAYVDNVNQIQAQFSSTYSRIASQITSTTTAGEDRATLSQLEGAIDDTVVQLRAVKPPSEVSKLHGQLVDVLQGYGARLSGLTSDLLSASPERVSRATTALAAETTDTSSEFTRKIAEINSQLRD